MKTLIIALLCLTSFCVKSQTTEEEYNYCTKGYLAQVVEQGGDVKKGYSIKDITKSYWTTVDNCTIHFLNLVRDEKKELAATILLVKYSPWSGTVTKTYCIPYMNEELEKTWSNEVNSMDPAILRSVTKSMSMHLPSR
jgi:hypothetical protein